MLQIALGRSEPAYAKVDVLAQLDEGLRALLVQQHFHPTRGF